MAPDDVIAATLASIARYVATGGREPDAMLALGGPLGRARHDDWVGSLAKPPFQRAWSRASYYGMSATTAQARDAVNEALDVFGKVDSRRPAHPLRRFDDHRHIHRALHVLAAAYKAREAQRMMEQALGALNVIETARQVEGGATLLIEHSA